MHELMFQAGVKGMSEQSERILCINITIFKLTHSFDTCLKNQLMHLTTIILRSTLGPKLYGNFIYVKLYTVEEFRIGHIAAQRRLN